MPGLLPAELPVRCSARHHWVTMLALPSKAGAVVFAVLLIAAFVAPTPMAWILGIVVLAVAAMRWQAWRAAQIILTGRRIIRVDGVPETTRTEASLRLDRISGAQLTRTVPGKLFGYGSIELVAPGEHQSVRRIDKIDDPDGFYLELRQVIFGELPGGRPPAPDPIDSDPPGDERTEYVTEPLPTFTPPERSSFWRRW